MKNLLRLALLGGLVTASAQAATYNVAIDFDNVRQEYFYNLSEFPVDNNGTPTILVGDRVNFPASAMYPLYFTSNENDVACNNNCSVTFIAPSDPSNNVYAFFCGNPDYSGSMYGNIRVNPNPDVMFIGTFDLPIVPAGF